MEILLTMLLILINALLASASLIAALEDPGVLNIIALVMTLMATVMLVGQVLQ